MLWHQLTNCQHFASPHKHSNFIIKVEWTFSSPYRFLCIPFLGLTCCTMHFVNAMFSKYLLIKRQFYQIWIVEMAFFLLWDGPVRPSVLFLFDLSECRQSKQINNPIWMQSMKYVWMRIPDQTGKKTNKQIEALHMKSDQTISMMMMVI